MKYFLAPFFALFCIFSITGCSEESSITDTGSGSQTSDGGAESAKFAGTYKGDLTVTYSGSGIPQQQDSIDVLLVVAKDGTVKLTGEDTAVNGVISGDKVSIDIKLVHKETGLSCTGLAVIKGTASTTAINGPVTGNAECKILAVDTKKATLSGSLTVIKQ